MVVFWLLEKEWNANFVQIQGKKLAFLHFFRMREHCLKIAYGTHQNALMGTFCRILHWPPCSGRSWRDAFVSKPTRVIGAGLIHSLSAVTNVLFTFDPKLHFSFCWMDKITSKLHNIFSSFIPELESPDSGLSQCLGNGLCINKVVLLQVVLRIVAWCFPPPHIFFLLTFLDQLDKRMDGRLILPSVSAWLFSGEKQNKCTVKKKS